MKKLQHRRHHWVKSTLINTYYYFYLNHYLVLISVFVRKIVEQSLVMALHIAVMPNDMTIYINNNAIEHRA